ncbi:hypothetical protein PO909_011549 [Leuciscus waleckii]
MDPTASLSHLLSKPQPVLLPRLCCLPTAPLFLLSLLTVIWIHLGSSVSHLPLGEWIPWLRRHDYATDLRDVCCALSLHTYSSVWLRPTSGFALDLSRSSSTSALRYPGSTSGGRRYSFVTAYGVAPEHRLSVCTQRSTTISSLSVVAKEIPAMAPPTFAAAVDLHPGWTLGFHLAAPGFSLAPPTIYTTLVFSVFTPPGFLSSTRASFLCLREVAPLRDGAYCQGYMLFGLCLPFYHLSLSP